MEYNTGAFAKKSNVSERTVRYYDRIGLLKPSYIQGNGYRVYTEDDYSSLQIIMSLKALGFSLEEIRIILSNNDKNYIKDSLELQLDLLSKKINDLNNLKYWIEDILHNFNHTELDLTPMEVVIKDRQYNETLVSQYYDERNLEIRENLHNKYRTNKKTWFSWLRSQMNVNGRNRIVDIGCGNGSLWKGLQQSLRNRELFLCDISERMIDEAKKNLGNEYSYVVANCENLRFQNSYFDMVVANHMLFYLRNLDKGLEEIQRVLKKDGILYASAYGKNHMIELNNLVKGFDERIELSPHPFYDVFGVENGKEKLLEYFDEVKYIQYEDELYIEDVEDILAYVLSCRGNQMSYLSKRFNDFEEYLICYLQKNGKLRIQKEVGLFIAEKKCDKE